MYILLYNMLILWEPSSKSHKVTYVDLSEEKVCSLILSERNRNYKEINKEVIINILMIYGKKRYAYCMAQDLS